MYPEAFGNVPEKAKPTQDTSGFKAAASAGATRLGGEFELLKGKLGVKSEAEAQKEYETAQAKAAARFTPTEKGWTEAPFLKFKETLGGSVPYMAAPAAAGLAALAAPVAAPVAAGLGLLGAGAVSTGQFTGSNLAAQMETGKTLEEASLGKAFSAAVPQALIDTAAMALLPGVGKLFGSVGSKLTAEQAKAIASQTLARTAADYTAKTGVAMGREGITEVAQQVLERLQAGLEIADPEARKEYIDSFIGGAVLGGTLAPVGRAVERGGAKSQAAAEERKEKLAAGAEQQRLAAEDAAKEAAFKQSPAYVQEATKIFQDLVAEQKALKGQLRKIEKGSPTEVADKEFNKDINAQISALSAPLKAAAREYNRVLKQGMGAPTPEEELRQQQMEQETAAGQIAQQVPGEMLAPSAAQMALPGMESVAATQMPETTPAEVTDYAQQVRQLKQLDEDQQTQIASTSDPKELLRLLDLQDKTRAALEEANKAAAATPQAIGSQIASVTRRLEIAKEEGDSAKIRKYAQQLLDLQEQGVTDQQQEIPLAKFKGKSETTASFNRRLYEPQGYTQAEQVPATDQTYEDYLSDQETLDRMRQEGFTEQDIARMEKQARMGVVGGESAAVSEQGLLFGEETAGGIKSGEERAAPVASRAELQAEIQIARDTGNKAAATRAQKQLDELTASEKGEDKFAGTTAGVAPAISRAQQPVRVSQQQAAADARAKAYADMVSIVSKYNRGLAKSADLETARAAVVDNLIADIEATRGVAVPEEEARAIAAQANQLLYDLVSRFGDTRNLSQKDKDLFLPVQNKDGTFSTAPVEGKGMPTVESRAPGRQTFAKQFAASQSIKEGLNELKNKAIAADRTTVERKLSVAQDTENALRYELDRAFSKGDIPAAPRQLLEAIGDNLKVISGNPEFRSVAAEFAARLNARLTPSAELTADLKAVLAQVEAAKRSETQLEGGRVTTAQQRELGYGPERAQYTTPSKEAPFSKLPKLGEYSPIKATNEFVTSTSTVFDSPADFNKWLASDALQQMRSSIGLGMPTIARLLKRLAPFQKRADAFRQQADALTTRIETLAAEYESLKERKVQELALLKEMTEAERAARLNQLGNAQTALRQAEERLKDIRDKMDAELSGYQQEFIQAETAFNFSVQTSEDITKAIAANTAEFQKGEMAAIRKVLDAKAELNALLKDLKSDMFPGGADKTVGKNWADVLSDFSKDAKVVAVQQKIVDATRQWRSSFALNQTQNRVVAFLDKDLGYQMQLQEEANQLDELAQNMLNAKMTLDLAFKQQQRSRTKQAALRTAGQDVLDAQALVAQAETNLAEVGETEADLREELGVIRTRKEEGRIVEVMKASTELEEQLVAEMNAASNERDAQLAEAKRLTPKLQRRLTPTPEQLEREQLRRKKRKQEKKVFGESQVQREARDNEERRIEQERVEALQALPAERVSFEKRRKLLDVVNAVPERVLELDAVIDGADEMAVNTQERADRIQAAIADLDKQIEASAKIVFKKAKSFKDTLESNSEKVVLDRLREERAALAAAAPRVEEEVAQIKAEKVDAEGKKAALLKRAADIEAQFSNDVQYNEANEPIPNPVMATTLARIPKVKQNIANNEAKLRDEKGQSKKTRESREAAIRKYERELKTLEARLETKRGIERESSTNAQLEERKVLPLAADVQDDLRTLAQNLGRETDAYKAMAEQAEANALADQRKKLAAAEQTKNKEVAARRLAEAALDLGRATPAYKKALKEQLEESKQAGTFVAPAATERLKSPVKGPVVRKIGAGQGKVLQAGQVRPVTGLQAQRQSTEAARLKDLEKRLLAIEAQQARIEPSIEDANKKNDPARAERIQKYSDTLNAEYAALEAELGKLYAKTAPKVAAETEKPVYRTTTRGGPSLATQEVSRLADRITENWKNVPEIVVVATEQELPLRILGQLVKGEREKVTPGLFDPKSGKVYLIASNLHNANDVALTIAHEVAGHFGLRTMLGGTYTSTMDSLYAGNPAVRKQADAKMAEDSKLSQQVAVEEVLADMAETGGVTPAEKGALRRIYDALKTWFRTQLGLPNVSDAEVRQVVTAARKYVMEGGEAGKGMAPEGEVLRRTKQAAPANALESLAQEITTQTPTLKEKLGSNLALRAEMGASDMRAGLRETLRFGDDNLFTQAMYHVRKAEQKMAQMFTVMNSGPLVAYKDDKGFVGYRSSNENSARDVFDAIADIPVDDPQLKTNIAQAYMVAQRAANKGLSKLDLGELGVTQEKLDAALAAANSNPALKNALENVRRKYNAYNKGMIEFLASTGRISKKAAADLLKDGDYVPYYRVKGDNATLNFGNNVTFNVGDIRRQPYLAELKGGETKLLPLNEAIQQNTLLLTDMALTNNAAKSVAYGLQALGKGMGPVDPRTGKPSNLMPIKTGSGPADARTIRFFQEPDPNDPKDTGERHLVVNTKGTAAEGIPSELVVQSLEGASLALPGFLKLAGAASDLLRAGVTRTPLYIARKLVREPMAAAFTGGLNSNAFSAVFKAGAEFVRMSRGTSDAQAKLIEKGLIQSNIFSGDMSDMKKMALQLASGKDQGAFEKVLAAADRYAMRADAATLALVLQNAEANGLSEVEADMMTMESMNFYKRGLSPTLQYASRLIPFFNAQIQGLSVLAKAARGNMPFEEQQQIKRKFFNNAVLLTFTGLVYAMAMEDDETFRNARPRDKYSNFFMPIPGLDEPLKLPIPFEAGYFFSLAVAAVDSMRAETDGKAQWKAIKDLFLGSIPGYSSMGIPQIAKPAFEVWANKNFMTGAPVESLRLQGKDAEERYLSTTTELAKQMSKVVPVLSPIQIEHLVRGYLGVLPLVAAAGANSLFESETKGARAEGRASDLPLIGGAFQKKYGGGDADVVYREAQEAMQARNTLNDMLKEGRREDAAAYREKNKANLAMAAAAGQYRQVVGRINADIRRTQDRNDLTPEEKRIRLDALDKAKQERADAFIKLSRRMEERAG